ncbi:MAG TPA: carboxypeptidase-like regulatory domain-containing protein, partial [Mariniphaga sp.]|nr:carboxypeptidase-like regulatory domain-containing protein [Mariniphaga sp.]
MKKIALMLISIAFLGMLTVEAQVRRISGTVTSAEDGAGIPGVSVVVKGTTLGTITNIDGEYQLDVPNDAETLVFSFVGMRAVEQPITGSVIDVLMESETIGVEEVVVTGYGVTRKVAFTGSASTVDERVITRTTDADPIRSLEGAVAGLSMSAETGQPGGYNSVLIRGLGSFNSGTQPLYVIDGVQMSTGAFGMRTDEDQTINPLATLNPNDIESISVLKDATATSIYGARASNGVIVINTKKGVAGATKFTLNVKGGVSTIPERNDYRQLNATEWKDFIA